MNKHPKNQKGNPTIHNTDDTPTEVQQNAYTSSEEWDYIDAVIDKESYAASSHVNEDVGSKTSIGPLLSSEAKEMIETKVAEHLDDPSTETCTNKNHNTDSKILTRKLDERWKAMRHPPEGHVHNIYCPFWRPGDSTTPRPECPGKTFTLLSGNPFTKAGAAYLTQWDKERKRYRERRIDGNDSKHL